MGLQHGILGREKQRRMVRAPPDVMGDDRGGGEGLLSAASNCSNLNLAANCVPPPPPRAAARQDPGLHQHR
jgi:hypothetical protein